MNIRFGIVALLLLGLSEVVTAVEGGADHAAPLAVVESPRSETVLAQLTEIRDQIAERRQEQSELKKRLERERGEEEIAAINRRLVELPPMLESLGHSFEQLATGGIDFRTLENPPSKSFNWKDELVLIAEPILGSLRSITEKPRKIEHFRTEIAIREQQLEEVERAETALRQNLGQNPPKAVAERLEAISLKWQQKREDIEGKLKSTQYQMDLLEGEGEGFWSSVSTSVRTFVSGRGLTLTIAVVALIVVWLLSRALLALTRLLNRRSGKVKRRYTRDRAVLYIYRFTTIIFMVITLMAVFYARSDLLLLAITLVISVMSLLALRQTLPNYVKEIRTLLDIGSIRVDERLVYEGVPMEVKAINAFAYLRNPELEGVVRLPLETATGLISRLPLERELWFPCRKGEFLLLESGPLVEVASQTLERVQLRYLNTIITYPTADFINLAFRNISRDGFMVPLTFGIDYRHQAICLTEVPQQFRQRLEAAITASDEYQPHFEQVSVEFKEAGASSLDYLIQLQMRGAMAHRYRALERFMQRTLVAVCNDHDWGIPFAQLTIHRGDGFE
ncbi:MAG: hypothetical protein HQL48_09840 [Gammaproteobacteria bacterium]|nr:hypothetical protein [Gammaproteobacteria bacterium]